MDAVCDGEDVLIPGIMEHVERAGVHSGDSMAIYPGLTLSEDEVDTIVDYTTRIAKALGVRGLMNVQYVVVGGPAYRSPASLRSAGVPEQTGVYVIEVNPRSSRTIPFISKVTGVPMVRLAVKAMLGVSLKGAGLRRRPLEAAKARWRESARLLHVQASPGRQLPGARNEVNRRGDGDRLRLPRRRRESAHGRGHDAAPLRLDSAQHRRP